MNVPNWALSLSFWLHMIATITWFGGIGVYSIVALPIIEKQVDLRSFANLLNSINKKIDPIGWFSLSILTFTGLFQMSSNENYSGLLIIQNNWAKALLFKHLVFGIVIILSSIYTWKILPQLEREIFKLSQNMESTEFPILINKTKKVKRSSFIFGVLILLFTAVSRIS